jgi:hypothetical protein
MKRRAFLALAALLPWLRPKAELPSLEELDAMAERSNGEWRDDRSGIEFYCFSSARIQKIAEHLRSTGQASA